MRAIMKIAIIGGNLLGCATAVHLALVEEHDRQRTPESAQSFHITIFERSDRLGGNSLKSVRVDDGLRVEVGTYRTLSLFPGTHLSQLIDIANDNHGVLSILHRRIFTPGPTTVRRGRPNMVPVCSLWNSGTHQRVVRSFAVWDWRTDIYNLRHQGWQLLDLAHRVFKYSIWRTLALLAFVSAYRNLSNTRGAMNRGVALIQVILMLLVMLIGPGKVIERWQQQCSFWGTTLPLLWTYGVTPAVSRGSSIGFVNMLSEISTKKTATLSPSVGRLVEQCGLDNYLRGTGDDFARIFKFNSNYVDRFIAPVAAIHNEGRSLSDISSLATHFALLNGDHSNSDASKKLSTLLPHNAALCAALIVAARTTNSVDVRSNTGVTRICQNDESIDYQLTLSNDSIEKFDGIVLCATARDGELTIETDNDQPLHELLGYQRDSEAAKRFAEQDAAYRSNNSVESSMSPIGPSACSHLAVIIGRLNASFFHFSEEKGVPDLVQISHAPGVASVERIRESTTQRDGVYSVLCGEDFVDSDVFKEMFRDGATVKYFEPIAKRVYSNSALPEGHRVDDCAPPIVLGPRFVYAAALECLAKHPEIDAMAAANAASLFSTVARWSTEVDADTASE